MIAGAIVRRAGSAGMLRWKQRRDGTVLIVGARNEIPSPSDVAYLLRRAQLTIPEVAEIKTRLYMTAEGIIYEPSEAFR